MMITCGVLFLTFLCTTGAQNLGPGSPILPSGATPPSTPSPTYELPRGSVEPHSHDYVAPHSHYGMYPNYPQQHMPHNYHHHPEDRDHHSHHYHHQPDHTSSPATTPSRQTPTTSYHTHAPPPRRLDPMYDYDYDHHHQNPDHHDHDHDDDDHGHEGHDDDHEDLIVQCYLDRQDELCKKILEADSVEEVANNAFWKTQRPNPYDLSGPRFGANANSDDNDINNPFTIFHSDHGYSHNHLRIMLPPEHKPDENGFIRLKFKYWAYSGAESDKPVISSILLTCGVGDNKAQHIVNPRRNSAPQWIEHSVNLNYQQALDGCTISFPEFGNVMRDTNVDNMYYHMVLVYNNIAFDNIEFYHVDDCFNCGDYATCRNIHGDMKCVCKPGYRVDAYQECQPDCSNRCHKRAICIAPGNCQCELGYVGHGYAIMHDRLGEGCLRDASLSTPVPTGVTDGTAPTLPPDECDDGYSLVQLAAGPEACKILGTWTQPVMTSQCSVPCGPGGNATFTYEICGNNHRDAYCDPDAREYIDDCPLVECPDEEIEVVKPLSCRYFNNEYGRVFPALFIDYPTWPFRYQYLQDSAQFLRNIIAGFDCSNIVDWSSEYDEIIDTASDYRAHALHMFDLYFNISICNSIELQFEPVLEIVQTNATVNSFLEFATGMKTTYEQAVDVCEP